jgi:hypothetical protein
MTGFFNQASLPTPQSLPMKHRLNRRICLAIVMGAALIGVLGALLLPALKQPPQYHRFADVRSALRIPNLLNVTSNLFLLAAGLWGFVFLLRRRGKTDLFIERSEQWTYLAFFMGLVLTGMGSGYYHWSPMDSTLVWDRLPMTMMFMAILAATIAERISVKAGICLLIPLVVAGFASVFYWQYSGNLWPYVVAQYFSMMLVLLIMLFFPSRYTRGADLMWVFGIYSVAKICEMLDAPIFSGVKIVSGHTLKHLFAALAACQVLKMISSRAPAEDAADKRGSRG